jgi:hypothetical protein
LCWWWDQLGCSWNNLKRRWRQFELMAMEERH